MSLYCSLQPKQPEWHALPAADVDAVRTSETQRGTLERHRTPATPQDGLRLC